MDERQTPNRFRNATEKGYAAAIHHGSKLSEGHPDDQPHR